MQARRKLLTAALLAGATFAAQAQGYTAGTLTIAHPYALPTPPGATTGGGYLKDIANGGTVPDALVGVSSSAADAVQLHTMQMDGNVMRMRAVKTLVIAPGQHVGMAPGDGYHLMFIGIHKSWAVGDAVPLTLQFEHAGRVDVVLQVQPRDATPAMGSHDMHP